MAWYPRAKKWELQPESDAQPAIRPTQFIVHSIIAPWTARRTYEYWRDSTNLESHFGIGYEADDVGQFIGTQTRADANASANRRSDGTGAVSAETASNTKGTDPWTDAQVEELIQLGVWLHEEHGIPLRICRSHADPGFGYHSMFSQWSTSGTACPGKARIAQFKQTVFPGIVARATGKNPTPPKETDMPLTSADIQKLCREDKVWPAPKDAGDYNPDPKSADHYWALGTHIVVQSEGIRAVRKQLAAMTATIDKLVGLVGSGVDTETVIAEVRKAITESVGEELKDAVIDVNINTGA